MARSGDEPFSLYGLIAQSVEVPDDRSSITFHLRPEARFSDGAPITPEDVLFSHQILKEKGFPYHRSHYAKVATAEKTGPHSVRFTFSSAGDREIPLIMGLLPVLPRHLLTPKPSIAPRSKPRSAAAPTASSGSIRAAPSPIAAIPTGGRATSA
jgi:peptide/nickel transport system substrate-binding protein